MFRTLSKGVFAVAILLLVGAGCSANSTVSVQESPEQEEVMMEKENGGEMMEQEAAQPEEGAMMEGEKEATKDEGAMMKLEVKADGEVMMENEGEAMMKKDEEGGEATKAEEKMMDQAAAPARAGSYEAYAPEKLAYAAQGKVVLFFHAPWCPTCKAVNGDIELNRGDIPAGVTLLKVDYDSNAALKQKYGVTYQHTFVQVDAEGNMLKKWSGGLTLKDVLGNVQ